MEQTEPAAPLVPSTGDKVLQNHLRLDEERYYRDIGRETVAKQSYQAAYEDLDRRMRLVEAERDRLRAQVQDLQAQVIQAKATPRGDTAPTGEPASAEPTPAPA